MIPTPYNSDFVANMENVLDIYKRSYDSAFPVVCMDESFKQLIKEMHTPIPAAPGRLERHDYEYERCGTCNIFMACEPLSGKRIVQITKRKTKKDWAKFLKMIADHYKNVEKITLVMDNLSTHKPGSFYEAFPPDEAKKLWDRFEFVYTPKHGSWLNIAEIELNVLFHQCLKRRIDNIDKVTEEVGAWQQYRNNLDAKVNWHFTSDDARIKLKRLYPTLED